VLRFAAFLSIEVALELQDCVLTCKDSVFESAFASSGSSLTDRKSSWTSKTKIRLEGVSRKSPWSFKTASWTSKTKIRLEGVSDDSLDPSANDGRLRCGTTAARRLVVGMTSRVTAHEAARGRVVGTTSRVTAHEAARGRWRAALTRSS
jgi:hypothetical protein